MKIGIVAALVFVAALGVAPAHGEIGFPTNGAGTQDTCEENNSITWGSCIQFPPGDPQSHPVVVYIDTGRADGRPGLWQETNTWFGLQKDVFYEGAKRQFGDESLLG